MRFARRSRFGPSIRIVPDAACVTTRIRYRLSRATAHPEPCRPRQARPIAPSNRYGRSRYLIAAIGRQPITVLRLGCATAAASRLPSMDATNTSRWWSSRSPTGHTRVLPSGERIFVRPRQSTDFWTRKVPSAVDMSAICPVRSFRLTNIANHFPSGDQSSRRHAVHVVRRGSRRN